MRHNIIRRLTGRLPLASGGQYERPFQSIATENARVYNPGVQRT